jgi:hypothetical protein
MASTILPSPFPDDRPFTTADLQTFSTVKLLNKDPEELARLLLAGEKDGFFYLDLTAPESRGLWDDYHGVLSVMKGFFDLPLDQKTPFAYGSDVQGSGVFYLNLLKEHADIFQIQAHRHPDWCY